MAKSIFDFACYREYVAAALDAEYSRGRRIDLAKFLGCQSSFISQVLTARAHFTLEHALRVSEFLSLSATERSWFMLQVQRDRSGTLALRTFYQQQLDDAQKRHQSIVGRIGIESTSEADMAIYYSAWWYAAIHMLVGLPEIRTDQDIANRLQLELPLVCDALDFLLNRGLVSRSAGTLEIGCKRLHIGAKSRLVTRHHLNWREKAISALERKQTDDLHYSGVLAISRQEAKNLRALVLDLLQRIEPAVQNSTDEVPIAFLIDLFEL